MKNPMIEVLRNDAVAYSVLIGDIKKRSNLVRMVSNDLFGAGQMPLQALRIAVAWVGAMAYMVDDFEMALGALEEGINITEVVVDQDGDSAHEEEVVGSSVSYDDAISALSLAGYITPEGELGDRFLDLISRSKQAYVPALATEGVTRRFGYGANKVSALAKRTIEYQESVQFTVCDFMYKISAQVEAKRSEKDVEDYVMVGCSKMSSELGYVSEFKADGRGRTYQMSCHGPNGQAGDRSRALQDLFDVEMDYDVETAKEAIKDELADMVGIDDVGERQQLIKGAYNNPVDFICHHLDEGKSVVTKPYSFVKAAHLLVELHRGNKPYIGMAFGLDAKCSGPQNGALLVGDQSLAASCGFSQVVLDDAYKVAAKSLEKAGFAGLTRSMIKKPFMGIFYGQQWRAFCDEAHMASCDIDPAVWGIIHGEGAIVANEEAAKLFHSVICNSFGQGLLALRAAFRKYADKELVAGAVPSYLMPDGSEVKMNYKLGVNVLGEFEGRDVTFPNVTLTNNVETFRFRSLKFTTNQVDQASQIRKGFVHMIQATDGLLARLILSNLQELGVKHAISIHDCFRVSVMDIPKLEVAIKRSYQELFGTRKNERSENLPLGTDILSKAYNGFNTMLANKEEDKVTVSQFFTQTSLRRLQKINGVPVTDLIDDLGNTYYFAK